MTKKELIDSLPEVFKPWAELWLPVLLQWSEEVIQDWLYAAMGLSWDVAYLELVDSMTTEQKVKNLELVNKTLAELNGSNEAMVNLQRNMILELVSKLLMSIK